MSLFGGKKHLSSFQIIFYGFSLLILAGALLLMTPLSSWSGQWTSIHDALFTATSAVCVTGLVVRDTATYWSLFGQMIILLLIQIGGLGIVMTASAISIASGRKISLMQRAVIRDSINAPQLGGIVRLTRFIVTAVAAVEGTGAALLAIHFIPAYGVKKGLWYSVFHSVSAMCNAGFDLMGNYSSLISWASDPLVLTVIAALIIIGGIGFMTWYDFSKYHFRFRWYSLQSKMILISTAILIVLPTLYFYFFEFKTGDRPERFLTAFFQAVTPRTAGFNSVDLSGLSEAGTMIMIVLMLTGGAPGSTAGGMKTTTLCVLLLTSHSIFRRQDKPSACRRCLSSDTSVNAQTIALMYVFLFITGACVISRIEGLPLLTCMFETASAVGTVGLTLGITSGLSLASRAILIGLMFVGRIGGLTMIYAIFSSPTVRRQPYVTEKVIVG